MLISLVEVALDEQNTVDEGSGALGKIMLADGLTEGHSLAGNLNSDAHVRRLFLSHFNHIPWWVNL